MTATFITLCVLALLVASFGGENPKQTALLSLALSALAVAVAIDSGVFL